MHHSPSIQAASHHDLEPSTLSLLSHRPGKGQTRKRAKDGDPIKQARMNHRPRCRRSNPAQPGTNHPHPQRHNRRGFADGETIRYFRITLVHSHTIYVWPFILVNIRTHFERGRSIVVCPIGRRAK
ncbi:hypothetical protein B0T17DRAFT_376264 [Bombardia bombarda]|uniref:Uncharacterized protein n=1 Tax=Bombardia bombarda TaxID=252184 RepID=A0AA40BVE0_9PEZI|nr:hypothetical protein B0T17DRAFT_376264 [Bombardia bombarda]